MPTLPPAEPPDPLELHKPVRAVKGGFLVARLKPHHAALGGFEARESATFPEEALKRPIDPHQRRILTPPVKLAEPFIGATDRCQ